ncbi:MAG: YceD family protein [Gaiella sp.]
MTTFALRTLTLRPGQEERLTIPVDVESFRLGGHDYVVASPVPVALTVQRTLSGDVLGLRFTAALAGPCMRCLRPAEAEVTADVREYEAEGSEAAPELHTEYIRDGEIELSAWVRDQIAFALPEQILCRPECAGLCPVCGKDLNDEPHDHLEETADPRWAALEALREES